MFTVNELIAVYYLFLEVKQVELVIYIIPMGLMNVKW